MTPDNGPETEFKHIFNQHAPFARLLGESYFIHPAAAASP